MVTKLEKKIYSSEEYLELEESADIRHEFINGKIIPIAGGTTQYNLITGNIYLALRIALKGKNLPIYIENVRLWIPDFNVFTYPDIMVMTGDPIYHTSSRTTVTNALTIMEILSNSSRDYDQGRKFTFYGSIKTLQEYVLVEQETSLVMLYRRNSDKDWHLQILEGETDILSLLSLKVEIPLKDIYEGFSK